MAAPAESPVSSPVPSPNFTGSKSEAIVDRFMDAVAFRTERFQAYLKTPSGEKMLSYIQLGSKLAIAIILAPQAPIVIATFAVLGTIVRAFSPEPIEKISASIRLIWNTIPFGVIAFSCIFAMTYTFVVFPICTGIAIGLDVGARISPYKVATALDRIVDSSPAKTT